MELQENVYRACGHYLKDMHHALSQEQHNAVSGWLRARRFDLLSGASSLFDPAYQGSEALMVLLQVEAFFKKNALFANDRECRRTAEDSFYISELRCRVTNDRLEQQFSGRTLSLLERMQFEIAQALGPFDRFLDEIPRHWKVGTGATLHLPRSKSFPNLRVSARPWVSPGGAPYIQAIGKLFGMRVKPRTTPFNRVEFVPKSWKTHRTIACEPEGNSFLQACFDSYVRKPLRLRFGVDLKEQDRNQELALKASIDGSLATIDLEAASDSVSLNLVHLLFPRDWAKFLVDIRSPYGRLRHPSDTSSMIVRRAIRYEKFASMGNGSTFPVETLVFAAACKALGSKEYAVYGDDIIIETGKVPDLRSLLAVLGFVVNENKSHDSGYYRESCGLHAYKGRVITPLYIRDLDERKPHLCLFVNNLWRMVPFKGEVWKFCKQFSLQNNLRASPQIGDMLSGVHCHVYFGYKHGLITVGRKGKWIPEVKVYTFKSKNLKFWDSRSYLLWFIKKFVDPVTPFESSRYSLGTHKYVSKWVGYFVAAGVPDHAYAWSEFYFEKSK